MYINDIHILGYLIIGIIGLIIGHIVNLCNVKLPEHKKIVSKEIWHNLKMVKPNYIIMFANCALYIGLLYKIGIGNPIKLIGFLVLVPMLLCAFYIDYKKQIIPNRLTLTIFELGLIYAFVQGIGNINMAFEMLLGGLVGSLIFLIITLVGGLIFGKESMGFGDVKLIGALGLFLGWRYIVAISILSFFIGAIYSIVLMVTLKIRKKEQVEYIAFGPFIVIAAMLVTFIPLDLLIVLAFKIFTLGKFSA